jgi:hypothetical protein
MTKENLPPSHEQPNDPEIEELHRWQSAANQLGKKLNEGSPESEQDQMMREQEEEEAARMLRNFHRKATEMLDYIHNGSPFKNEEEITQLVNRLAELTRPETERRS